MVQSAWTTIGVNVNERMDAVKRGLPITHLHDFLEKTGLPPDAVFVVLKLKKEEVENREKLTPEESERLWRLASVFGTALALFEGDSKRAIEWLSARQKALGNSSPLEHVKTEPGAAEVQELIGRIEHGVFS